MASDKKTAPLESFYRLVIMLGSVVVGGLALQVYGPPPEKLEPIFARARAIATDLTSAALARLEGDAVSEPTTTPPPIAQPPATALTPSAPAAPQFQPQGFQPPVPAALAPVGRSPSAEQSVSVAAALASDPSLAPLVARLESAGVDRLELAVWGADGRLIRGSCTAPRPGSAFRRMLDAIEASPRAALENLLARVEAPGALAQAY